MKSPLRLILRATRCHSTHHCFALDALPMVQTRAGERLVRLLLHHHKRYLKGATDPDTRYRDFQNHVVHVTDGYWGGAPRVAHQWYDRLQRYLRADRFSDAAHAAGVLSHYFTDPFQPLHTQHSPREAVLHRPIESSIRQSYAKIFKEWKYDEMRVVFQLSDQPGWLGEAILHGARFANRRYWTLLDGYDLLKGLEDPSAGLSSAARLALSETFGLAITGWARVLERAADDAEAARGKVLPRPAMIMPALSAMIQSPLRWWMVRTEFKLEHHAIMDLVDEFRRLGKLEKHLPSEVDIVDRVIRVYEDEKQWKQRRKARLASEPMTRDGNDSRPATILFPTPAPLPSGARHDSHQKGLSPPDPVIAAPVIGPSTASSFQTIGVESIGEFLDGDADEMADRIGSHWITPDTIRRWQSQTKLICEVPGLSAGEARILTGAGYVSAAEIAACEPETLQRDTSAFALSREGKSELSNVSAPSLAQVHTWIENAKGVFAAGDSPLRRSA